jgi:hypothetical protein
MTDPGAPLTLKELRLLGQAALGADDAALIKVVAMLDALERRGAADQVLDMVRPRLRVLGVARRLNLARLLFLPMDGAIRPPKEWRRGDATLPRAALGVLADIVAARLDPGCAALLPEMEGCTSADGVAISRYGQALWPAAARLLPEVAPPEWAATGLATPDYQAVAALCRPIWAQGPVIWAALAAAAEGPPEPLAHAALAAVAPAGPAALAIVLSTLLAVASAPGQLAHIAALLNPQARGVALQALDAVLRAPPPPFETLEVGRATDAAHAVAHRLDDLERSPLLGADRLRQVQAMRRDAEASCRNRFVAGAEQQVMAPLQRLAVAVSVRDEEVAAVEAAARSLRGLEAAGRRLGGALAFDRTVKELVGRLTAIGQGEASPAALYPIDIARSIEILAGPEAAGAAMAKLSKRPGPANAPQGERH